MMKRSQAFLTKWQSLMTNCPMAAPISLATVWTEADIRVFVTSIRFDAAYHGLFKCNIARLSDFPHLHAHMVRMLEVDAVRETVRLDHIKAGYYSIKALNPNGIVPKGPAAIEALLNKTQP